MRKIFSWHSNFYKPNKNWHALSMLPLSDRVKDLLLPSGTPIMNNYPIWLSILHSLLANLQRGFYKIYFTWQSESLFFRVLFFAWVIFNDIGKSTLNAQYENRLYNYIIHIIEGNTFKCENNTTLR